MNPPARDHRRVQFLTEASKARSQPRIFDDLLMMCQTEKFETDGTGCENGAQNTQNGGAH